MSEIPNFTKQTEECKKIILDAISRLDPKFKAFVSIAKFCKVYYYNSLSQNWSPSQHEGPWYLYISNDEEDDSVTILLHNHKSRENYKQTIGCLSQLKIKSENNFLVINNTEENIWLWFSFENEKTHFAKGIRAFWARYSIKLDFICDKEEEIDQDFEEEFLLPAPAQEKSKENLIKLLDIKENTNKSKFNFANLINLDTRVKEETTKINDNKVDDLFNKILSKHSKIPQPIVPSTAPRENLASMFNQIYDNQYQTQTYKNYPIKSKIEIEKSIINQNTNESPFYGNLISHLNKISGGQSSEGYQSVYPASRTNFMTHFTKYDNDS